MTLVLERKSVEARKLIRLFRETGDEAYLQAAALLDVDEVKSAGYQSGRGRRQNADWEYLLAMDDIRVQEGKTVYAAAVAVAPIAGGNSRAATIKRLDRKFRANQEEIEFQAAMRRMATTAPVIATAIAKVWPSVQAVADARPTITAVVGIQTAVADAAKGLDSRLSVRRDQK